MKLRLSLSGEKLDSAASDIWSMFDGVGMIRSEYLLRWIGDYFTVSSARDFVTSYVDEIAGLFSPRPVWYRTADFWTNEANPLNGIDRIWEEENPIVGNRGLRRGLLLPDMLELEARTLAGIAATRKNLHIMLSYVGDADEFAKGAEILARSGWPNRLGCMVEIPAAVLDAERLVNAGATNLMVGLNDLTCLLTGAARGSGSDNKEHQSVWWAIDYMAARLSPSFEWGIAGSLTKSILDRAREKQVPYASLHYSEVPALLDVDATRLKSLNVMREIKKLTRERAAEFAKKRLAKNS